jgi:hypothetical protein
MEHALRDPAGVTEGEAVVDDALGFEPSRSQERHELMPLIATYMTCPFVGLIELALMGRHADEDPATGLEMVDPLSKRTDVVLDVLEYLKCEEVVEELSADVRELVHDARAEGLEAFPKAST